MHIILLLGAVVSTSANLDFFLSSNIYNKCTLGQFACTDGQCIPNILRCDGNKNCKDDSDETNCEEYLCKGPLLFRCKNNRCISKFFVCNGDNDCEDFSDEETCESFKISDHINSTCEKGQWQCTDKLCILEEWVCNGDIDCIDGSDESIGCSANIACDGFKCKNGQCIPREWKCDGHNDCHDKSDEENCGIHVTNKSCNSDHGKFLCRDNKTCIDIHKVCNNASDCPDGSDEYNLCRKNEISCGQYGCEYDCIPLSTGPKCICPDGHRLNGKKCEDINECEQFDICDQKCRNTPGSYQCFCDSKYKLQEDKKTCKVVNGEAMMVFSSKTEIRGYMLESQLYYSVAKNLKQVVGVDYDGHHIYWTDIFLEHESIVRSIEDGSEKENIVTSGLGLPEDLSVDWLTGNIYFTDAENKHIGVCISTGTYCTILINKDIRKPRGIVLNVEKGDMYWTDWGNPAEIAYSLMDGSNAKSFVSSDIHWPNGLALDNPNERLYWTDAKKMTIESIKLDGTDRRMVLKGVVKHPYAIAVFENKLYWSDWVSHSIQGCNKFSGKDHHTIIKEDHELIYGMSIFHSALHQRSLNPCLLALCSDICLLKGNSYTCACPQNKKLSNDGHVCKEFEKKQMLIVGTRDKLILIEHTLLGKHKVTYVPSTVDHVGALTYDSSYNNLIISDLHTKQIISLNLDKGISEPLDLQGLGHVIALDYDPKSNNLYLCDFERDVLEVVNLNTLTRKVLLHSFNGDIPEAIALVPEEGVMFVAFQKFGHRHSHVDRFYMDGSGRTHTTFENDLIGPIALHYDADLHRIFVADAGTGNIESTSIDGDDRHSFRSLNTNPIDITSLNNHLFWVNEHSKRIYWADKNSETSYNQKITLDIPDSDRMHIVSVVPAIPSFSLCRLNNNNCSHLCLLSHKSVVCACPLGFELSDNNHTCIKQAYCNATEFLCSKSNTCILKNFACNGRKDCPHGEDEMDCFKPNSCSYGYFQCSNGDCIKEDQQCDHNYDCKDKSDEQNCNKTRHCASDQFMCEDGECIPETLVCNEHPDCMDNSDEVLYTCQSRTCLNSQFRCNSGACIPKTWECDHDYDCSDFSDEHPNCIYASCPPTSFTCANGKCIDRSLYCDETDDCGDNSDEHLCWKNLGSCNFDEFPCSSFNKSVCLPHSAMCNGTKECPLGEDERDCSNCVEGEEFTCEENHKCIPNQWVCDGTDDCGNNSDEKVDMCVKKTDLLAIYSNKNHTSCENGFRCKDGKCIQLALTCNKIHDCYDGSDEDGLCDTACEVSKHPCSQACFSTPIGPKCLCRDGYTLMANGYSCLDKNECLDDPPVCSQLCHNEDGGYRCDCYGGFLLRANQKSCKADGESMSIIFTTDGQIREQSHKRNHLSVLFSAQMPRITGLDVLVKSKMIYFSTESASSIHRIDLKAQTRHFVDNVGQPQKLALDWVTKNVYYYNSESRAKSISICNFEAMCAQLIKVEAYRQVSSLAVDPVNKFLFIGLSSWWVFNSPSYTIYRYNLDGTGSKQLVETTSGFVTGLTYDFNKKYLYYADQHSNVISRITYEGTSKTVLYYNVTKSTGLKFFEDHLYYLTTGGYMVKCKLYDVRHCFNFKLHSYSTDLFTIAQDSVQPSVENLCKNHTCPYLCVMTQHSYKCLCKNGAVVSRHQSCNSTEGYTEKDTKLYVVHSAPINENLTKKHSGTVVAAVLIPLALLITAGTLLIMAKKKNSRRLNVSMRFYNPTYESHVDDEKPILQPGLHEYTNPAHYRCTESTDTISKQNEL